MLADFELEIEKGKPYRNAPLDLNDMIERGELKVYSYDSDIGHLRDLFNLGTDGSMRSGNNIPVEIRFEFVKPVILTGIRFRATNNNTDRFRVETTVSSKSLSNRFDSHFENIPWKETVPSKKVDNDFQSDNMVAFDKSTQTRILRFTFEKIGGDNFVHIAGLRLHSRQIVSDGWR